MSRRRRDIPVLAAALASGALIGSATSIGQAELGGVLSAFVNSASAWLVGPFVIGSLAAQDAGPTAAYA